MNNTFTGIKKILYPLIAVLVLSVPTERNASAQMATFDAASLAQAILSFLQDGDQMSVEAVQFLENLGVMQEQLEFLREMDQRYKKVQSAIYKGQEVARIARNYEIQIKMFSSYVNRLKSIDSATISYYGGRALVNEGFQYLLLASRAVKRAREYLSSDSRISEEERRKGLAEIDRTVSLVTATMYDHILSTYEEIDRGQALAENLMSLDDAFSLVQ